MDNKGKKNKQSRTKRYTYIDDNGNSIPSAGILPYTTKGLWLVGEKCKKVVLYTDIGGKYNYHDCDIYQTISREFNEELYHSVEITRSQVEELYSKSKKLYIQLSSKTFSESRDKVMKANPHVPDFLYKSVELKYFTYSEIEVLLKKNAVSTRLRKILAQFNQNYG